MTNFIVAAPAYVHTSAGIRVLHRLCHLLNEAGFDAAIHVFLNPGNGALVNAEWNTPVTTAPPGDDTVVVYPEIVSGNPLGAQRVVRYALNYPGVFGGDTEYSRDDMVFVYYPPLLARVSAAAGVPVGENRVLTIPEIDPTHIYPDPSVAKDVDCVFVYKGRHVRDQYRLPNEDQLVSIEANTPSMRHLGDLLRRTRRLYCYDHMSTLVPEAIICGCEVLLVEPDGRLVDPRDRPDATGFTTHDFVATYARAWSDLTVVHRWIAELRTRWPL